MSIESIVAAGQRLIAATLLDRGWIQDRTLAKDTTGGKNTTYVERSKAIRCRIVQVTDDEPSIRLSSNYGQASAVLQMPLGTKYKEGDRFRNAKDDKVWLIVTILTPPSAMATVERAGIKEV